MSGTSPSIAVNGFEYNVPDIDQVSLTSVIVILKSRTVDKPLALSSVAVNWTRYTLSVSASDGFS